MDKMYMLTWTSVGFPPETKTSQHSFYCHAKSWLALKWHGCLAYKIGIVCSPLVALHVDIVTHN